MKEKKMLILLLTAFVALAGCYAGIEFWNAKKEEQEKAEEEAAKIYLTGEESLTAVSYASGESRMGFVKEDGTWYDEDDREIPLSQDVVENFADAVGSLCAERELEDPDDVADYGLDSPSYTVAYTTEAGEEGEVYIGNQAEDDYYAMVKGSDKIYTITADLPGRLDFDLSGYIQNDTVPSISSGNLKKVEITENGSTVAYEEEEDLSELAGGWGTLSLAAPKDYHVTEETLADYGLDEASRTTAVAEYEDTDSGEKETFTVYLGSTDSDGNRYVMVKDSVLVYTISQSVAENMLTVDETTEEAEE